MLKFLTTIILGVLSFCITPQTAQAQNDIQDAASVFGAEFCKCVTPYLKQLDKDVVAILMGIPEDPEEVDAYLMEQDPEVLELFAEQMQIIETFGESEEHQTCMANIESKMARFEDKLDENFYEDPTFLNTVLEELEGSSKCQLAHIFLKIGLSMGGEEE